MKWNGHLATIRSKAENDWVERQFALLSSTHGLWIGYTDEAKEGVWVWTSGEAATFTNWGPGQPDNGGSNDEHFAHLWPPLSVNAGQWNDDDNSSFFRVGIVEMATTKASYSVFGRGCASTGKLPEISSASMPRLGQVFALDVTGFVPQPFGFLVLGSSNTHWGATPLPLALKLYGADGCRLLVSLESSSRITINVLGNATIPLPIPSALSLLGATFYGQAWASDPKANPLGIATTNGFKAVVGL